MNPPNSQDSDFGLSGDVLPILGVLRDNNLTWIAEEIESTISQGKLTTKEYSEKGKTRLREGHTAVPFGRTDQLRIVLDTLKNYFVLLYDVWDKALHELPRLVDNSYLKTTIVDLEGKVLDDLFPPDYAQQVLIFDKLLNEVSSNLE